MKLSETLSSKAATFPECSYGACRATLVLVSGKRVEGVVLAWGSEVVSVNGVKVASQADLSFSLSEVVDVLP